MTIRDAQWELDKLEDVVTELQERVEGLESEVEALEAAVDEKDTIILGLEEDLQDAQTTQ